MHVFYVLLCKLLCVYTCMWMNIIHIHIDTFIHTCKMYICAECRGASVLLVISGACVIVLDRVGVHGNEVVHDFCDVTEQQAC